ncbi:hypothetical protein Barb4_02437 [Bacteroidales bacterium Barb4]|nr:hypothetical protein Barb4_02437 [Bacteroidales bacterium Barb4]
MLREFDIRAGNYGLQDVPKGQEISAPHAAQGYGGW